MKKNYVEFFTPGSFFSESAAIEIENWNVDEVMDILKKYIKKGGTIPFGFKFFTKERKDAELDSHISESSCMYHLGGTIKTLEQVRNECNPENKILISNMVNNNYDKIIINYNSWVSVQPFECGDVLLPFNKEEFLNGLK